VIEEMVGFVGGHGIVEVEGYSVDLGRRFVNVREVYL
jgi:hypothetical protein